MVTRRLQQPAKATLQWLRVLGYLLLFGELALLSTKMIALVELVFFTIIHGLGVLFYFTIEPPAAAVPKRHGLIPYFRPYLVGFAVSVLVVGIIALLK